MKSMGQEHYDTQPQKEYVRKKVEVGGQGIERRTGTVNGGKTCMLIPRRDVDKKGRTCDSVPSFNGKGAEGEA